MLDLVDELTLTGLSDEDLLVSFDITNMFPSIDNQTGIERVRCKLSQYAGAFYVPIECVIEALEICLKKNCSMYIEGNIGCRKMVLLWDLRIPAHMPILSQKR
jgi:hypothetical protein